MAESKEKLQKLPLGEIKPMGWLRRELELQATGLTGRLDELWDDVSKKSAWLGGHGEAWERGPYYLDGLVSLAYLLDDRRLIDRVGLWIEKILSSVDASGFFGPVRTVDWWPRILALRALWSYYEVTGDKQIPPFVRNFFKYEFNNLDEQPFYVWAAARSFEQFIPMKRLFDETGDEMINQLVDKIVDGSYDWFSVYEKFRYKKPASTYLSRGIINFGAKVGANADRKRKYGAMPQKKQMSAHKIMAHNKLPTVRKLMLLHGVNNAMAVKYPVLLNDFRPDPELVLLSKRTVENLMKYHGTAAGVFTSDETLDGTNPSNGVELCTVVEFMRSLETLVEKTGDTYYADLLELNCFNALPATITKDYTAHQYVQQPNAIAANRRKRDFFNVRSDGTVYGLEPNYGCCTANMHQGFPKFTENLCYKTDEGFCFMVYSPCRISTLFKGVRVILNESTDYPFKNKSKIVVESVSGNPEIKFSFRVPQYTSLEVLVNGKKVVSGDKGIIAFKKKVEAGDVIELLFDMPLTTVVNPDKSISFRKGTLLFATKLRAKCDTRGKIPFCDYEYKTVSQWRTLPELQHKKHLTVIETTEREVSAMPFDEDNPPVEITYRARYVQNWNEVKNSAGRVPRHARYGKETFERTLVPYGCTRIRIAHHPVFK